MISKRPMFFAALAVSGGECLQYACHFHPAIPVVFFLFPFFFAVWLHHPGQDEPAGPAPAILILLSFMGAGMLRLTVQEFLAQNDVSRFADPDREVILSGTVQEAPRPAREHWRFVLAAHALSRGDLPWIEVQGNVLVAGRKLRDVEIGERILLRGRLRLPDDARNPGAFDYRLYLKALEIHTLFWCTQDSLLWRSGAPSGFSLARAFARVRAWISQQLSRFSSGQSLALLQGLLLGQREEIDHEVMESFAQTGFIHVLSVSGLHVGFVALILYVLCDLLRAPKRWQVFLAMLGLIFYAMLTGLQPPVVRATVMAIVLLLGDVFEREAEIYNSLGAAAVLILMWQPWQLFQLGFQLSFVAVLGIAYLYRPLLLQFSRLVRWRWPPVRWAVALLAVSFAAQFATLPFVLMAYGRLPLTAIWGNLIVIPVSFLAVAAGVVACLVASWSDFLLQVYGAVADFAVNSMILFTHWLAGLPGAYIAAVHAPLLLLVFYLLALAVFVEWRRPARRWLVLAALAVLNIFIWREASQGTPKLRLTFFDVDQGDAILLEFPRGRRMLIDAGPWYEYTDAGERVLLPYFAQQGIRRLHAVVITHPHADHLGGLPALLSSWLKIDTVYSCGAEIDSWLEQKCERLLDSLRVPRRALHWGDMLQAFPPARIGVLAAGGKGIGMVENVNDASVVLKVVWGETSMLFAGDAEWQSEWRMTRRAELLDGDLLKAGHHGSQTSSTLPFLKAVTPQWAVISAGRRNKFGHPHASVMARYEALGIRSIRTDLNGAVVFESDGKTLQRRR